MKNIRDKVTDCYLIVLFTVLILTVCVSLWVSIYGVAYLISLLFKFELSWIVVTAIWLIIVVFNVVLLATAKRR